MTLFQGLVIAACVAFAFTLAKRWPLEVFCGVVLAILALMSLGVIG